jgi:ubiquinone/menaquinone biosynthesis C-methylase UbiE
MNTIDVYRITNELDDATLDVMVNRMEARGQHSRFVEMMNEYLEAMGIDEADRVVDLGCGTGVAARAIVRRPGFSGRVLGVDRSPHLVDAANRFARQEGTDDRVEFLAGDSHSLDLDDEAFDAVVAHTLLSHVDDPRAVIGEIVRIAKPGGKVGIFDGDYASLTFATEDPEEGKRIDEKIHGAMVTNPRIMRQLPQLLADYRLRLEQGFPYVVAETGRADFWEGAIQSLVKLLPRAGAMTESEAEQWADGQFRRSEQGTFFGASNFYGYVATRP